MGNRSTPNLHKSPKRIPPKDFDDRDPDLDDAADGQDTGELLTDGNAGVQTGGDTGFDRIVGPEEAGLGGGLDQAEEARLGITDEELAKLAEHVRKPTK